MDWQMPGMDGIETTRMIQSDDNLYDVPTVIMVTAYGREEAEQESEGVDFASYLTKPVTSSTLLDAILLAMGREVATDTRSHKRKDEASEYISKLHGAKILLVEDNEINQELAMDLLTSNGLFVLLAENGQEALALLDQQYFDGVLMDCQMPIMDGYVATDAIRQQKRFAQLPVIAMTANAMAGDKDKVIEAGMNDHIAKPINVNSMFKTLAKWITPKNSTAKVCNDKDKHEDTEVLIPNFININRTAGMVVTQNNAKLYLKLLTRFAAYYKNSKVDFEHWLQSEDREMASRWAHSLKGTAGNIGAEEVQIAAGELEVVCVDEQRQIEIMDAFNNVEIALLPIMQELELFLEAQIINTDTAEYDFDKVQSLLANLSTLIQEYNISASDVIDELEPMFQNTKYQNALEMVGNAIGEFDFESASVALLKLESDLN
jgi:CheY-like chemotaxis protein/HPt (histidine-containing phosphotransfer) domain-containing protein